MLTKMMVHPFSFFFIQVLDGCCLGQDLGFFLISFVV
jgi:hypothetical protein